MPILNFSSEVWGLNEWPKLETIHLSACKYALGVKSSTTTMAVYSELGRIPVQCQRHINILKFFVRLNNLDNNRYASKAFKMLIRDADSGCSNWISAARSLQLLYGVKSSDKIKDIKFKVRKHFESATMLSLKESIS